MSGAPYSGNRAGGSGWETAPSPPASSEIRAGIGCKLKTNERGDLFIREVIPGSPAALSCEIVSPRLRPHPEASPLWIQRSHPHLDVKW